MATVDLAQLAKDVDRCVACGLCVPLCPTWQATRNEAHSPRGRIMMMDQIASGAKASKQTASYLDSCLGCGKCEEVCPSHVPFMRMLPQAKSVARPNESMPARAVSYVATTRRSSQALRLMASGARRLAPLLPVSMQPLVKSARLMPSETRWSPPSEPGDASGEAVSLFTGCFGTALDSEGLQAATRMLGLCGYSVNVPKEQACCGAIALHGGDLEKAASCAQENAKAFSSEASATIASSASGCAVQLAADPNLGTRHKEAGELVATRMEGRINLRQADGLGIVIHTPCTQRRLPGKGRWVREALEMIPGATVHDAPEATACCGAGGLTWLGHASMSSELADRTIASMADTLTPGIVLVSSNHGCRLHLAAALLRKGLDTRVAHPLAVLSDHASGMSSAARDQGVLNG